MVQSLEIQRCQRTVNGVYEESDSTTKWDEDLENWLYVLNFYINIFLKFAIKRDGGHKIPVILSGTHT